MVLCRALGIAGEPEVLWIQVADHEHRRGLELGVVAGVGADVAQRQRLTRLVPGQRAQHPLVERCHRDRRQHVGELCDHALPGGAIAWEPQQRRVGQRRREVDQPLDGRVQLAGVRVGGADPFEQFFEDVNEVGVGAHTELAQRRDVLEVGHQGWARVFGECLHQRPVGGAVLGAGQQRDRDAGGVEVVEAVEGWPLRQHGERNVRALTPVGDREVDAEANLDELGLDVGDRLHTAVDPVAAREDELRRRAAGALKRVSGYSPGGRGHGQRPRWR